MNYKDILQALFNPQNRRIGKTTIAAEFAKKVDGILVSSDLTSARRIEKEYGVETHSIQFMDFTKATNKPIIFDQDAFTTVLLSAIEREEKIIKVAEAAQYLLDHINRDYSEWKEPLEKALKDLEQRGSGMTKQELIDDINIVLEKSSKRFLLALRKSLDPKPIFTENDLLNHCIKQLLKDAIKEGKLKDLERE